MLSDAYSYLNAAAIKDEAVGRSGDSSNYAGPIATTIAVLEGFSGEIAKEIETGAKERARHIFQSGQDWRRELDLFNNFSQRNF